MEASDSDVIPIIKRKVDESVESAFEVLGDSQHPFNIVEEITADQG